jgi:predicted PurR-regulated permease PerM
LGAILAILFLPVQKKVVKKIKNKSLASFATILLILLIVIIPLYLLGQVLFGELMNLYNQYRDGGVSINKAVALEHLPMQARAAAESLLSDLSQKLSGLTSNIFAGITSVISNVANFFFGFFVVFFVVYYLLRDGEKLKDYANTVFPLSESHENLLITKLEEAVNGVVKGQFLVALVQGGVALIGFLIFGVPQPFLWGAFTVLAALVPNVGTSLAVIPAVIYLLIIGHTGAAIGMAVWGALAVGTIDNVISPKLIGSRTKLHPLLVLFSVIGGLKLFGILGFLLGPIFMAILVTLLDIYRSDLKGYLER